MSPATIERVAPGNADSEFYTGPPAFTEYPTAIRRPDLSATKKSVVHKKSPRWIRSETSYTGRNAGHYTDPSYKVEGRLVFEAFDMTGIAQQDLDLGGNLDSPPQPYAASINRVRAEKRVQTNDANDTDLQASKRTQVINRLAHLEIEDIDASSPFPLNAFSSLSPEEGAELDRILNEGPPAWVRAIIERKTQRG